jgi:hypothetical protein
MLVSPFWNELDTNKKWSEGCVADGRDRGVGVGIFALGSSRDR